MRALALMLSLVAAAGCKKVNGAYCDATRPCGAGDACDLVAHECHADTTVTVDMSMPDLYSGCAPACSDTTPICVIPTCLGCTVQADPEAACVALSPKTPHCATDGSCVGCRNAADCLELNAALCDATTHACRGCQLDSECASLVCDLTPGSTTKGRCIDPNDVVYVDGAAASNGTGLTINSPLQKIQDAMNKAVTNAVSRHYVRITAGTYNEALAMGATGKSLYLVGATGTIIKPNGGDAIGVNNGGTLTVRNIVASSTANGVNCQGAGSKFSAYNTQFVDCASQIGVYSDTNCFITLDGCWVNNNAAGITVGAEFVILNTIITNNRGTGGFNQSASNGNIHLFVSNTVANNPSVSGTAGGVTCTATGAPMVVNSILYNNTKAGGGIGETNCAVAYVATDDPALAVMTNNVDLRVQGPGFKPTTVPLSPDAFHILPTSLCRNAGTTSLNTPDHDFDMQPRPDPTSMKVDIGADELQ